MEVSVLVCTRNRPDFIKPCILSILNNTYHDFECLIVDQSTDNKTEKIVKKYIGMDKRMKYLRMQGQGKSRALNLGIRSSSGDIIATTDDDCTVAIDWIENIIKAFKKNPDVDIVYGKTIHKPDEFSMKDRKYSGRLSKLSFVGDGANRSARLTILKKLKGFDELLGPGAPLMQLEDQDFAYRALYFGSKILSTKQVIVTHCPLSLKSDQEIILSKRLIEIGKGALCCKAIRCFDLIGLLICLVFSIQRMYQISWDIMRNKKWSTLLGNKPRILLLLQIWVLMSYWNLLGMVMSLRYPIDRTYILFMAKE